MLGPILRIFRRIARLFTLTEGERSILLAAISASVFGAVLAFNFVMTLGGQMAMLNMLSAYELWVTMSGAIGALAGLYLSRNWMGHAGWRGLVRACAGIISTSMTRAVVGGTLALPFYGTMFGPFTLVMTLIGAPILAILWISTLACAHFLLATWRSERAAAMDAVMPAVQA